MSEDTGTRPAQFRLPTWAHTFLEEEAATYGTTKTEVVVKALNELKKARVDELMKEGYLDFTEEDRREFEEWEALGAEVWNAEEW